MIKELIEFQDTTRDSYDRVLELLKFLGVTYLSYAYDTPSKKFVYFSKPTWQKFYIDNDIHKLDPVRIVSNQYEIKYLRWDTLQGSRLSNELMVERENMCKIHSGFSLIYKGQDMSEILSVATDPTNYEIYNTLSHNINLLKMARNFMHMQANKEMFKNVG